MAVLQIQYDLTYTTSAATDYIFNIEAAFHPEQHISHEKLRIEPHHASIRGLDPTGKNRLIKISSNEHRLALHYEATVSVNYLLPTGIEQEIPLAHLPIEVMPYLQTSQFCDVAAVGEFAQQQFGALPPGYSRVVAICQWLHAHIDFQLSAATTPLNARQLLINRCGDSADFAHLTIALCRALFIPARLVTAYAWFAAPPAQLHTVCEVYLGGRWVLFDPTQQTAATELVRIATGKDAGDTLFACLFGPAQLQINNPEVTLLSHAPTQQTTQPAPPKTAAEKKIFN